MRNLRKHIFKRGGYIVTGVITFIFSIQLLSGATRILCPLLKNWIGFIRTAHKALGFGWLVAYPMLSGSPIAALALSFYTTGLLGDIAALCMIVGSRLGASFILIAIGLIEYIKGETTIEDSLSIAFLSFLITYSISFPALLVGLIFLEYDIIEFHFRLPFLRVFTNLYSPLVTLILQYISPLLSLPLALILTWLSLSIFERAFRKVEIKEVRSSWINYMMEKPYFSFSLGVLLTIVGQSVSLSIGIMVPLYLKGYIQRRNLIPYIMGANIATFTDTLTAALLLESSKAINIVMITILSHIIISIIILTFFYGRYYNLIEKTMNILLLHRSALILFLFLLFALPILLLLL